jgi:hypothetical protein
MMIVTCGYIISPYFSHKEQELRIPNDSIIVKNELATKLRFLSLLNFRRMLNTMRGITEDFLDTLVLFNIKLPEANYGKGIDLKELVNLGQTHKFLNDL